MIAQQSVTQPATARMDVAYQYAPYVGAALVALGLVLAVLLRWPGVAVGMVGLALAAFALHRTATIERRASEAAAAEVERQNRDLW